MSRVRLFVMVGALLMGLALALPRGSALAQDEDVDSLAAIQQTLQNFANWWTGSQPSPVRDVEMFRAEDGAFVMGNPLAPVTIVEFADFACPHCQRYRPAVTRFIEEYVETGMAKLEFRFFPTAGGQTTVLAGRAAECADEQRAGAFWEAHELLYEYALNDRYDDTIPEQLALDLRVNEAALLTCMETADQVEIDVALGREMGVSGTPAVMVRYGDGLPQFIELDGVTYNMGGPTFDILSATVEEGQYR